MSALLEVDGIVGGYEATQVLHGLSLCVEQGGVTALLGANGAGKTTLMKTLAGLAAGARRHGAIPAATTSRIGHPTNACWLGWCWCPKGAWCSRA